MNMTLGNRNRSLLFKGMSLSGKLTRSGVVMAYLNCDLLREIQDRLVNRLLGMT